MTHSIGFDISQLTNGISEIGRRWVEEDTQTRERSDASRRRLGIQSVRQAVGQEIGEGAHVFPGPKAENSR